MSTVAISLYDALISVKIEPDKAKAVVTAIEYDMLRQFATVQQFQAMVEQNGLQLQLVRRDITSLSNTLTHDLETKTDSLKHAVDKLDLKLTIKLTSIVVCVAGLLFAALRYFPSPHG